MTSKETFHNLFGDYYVAKYQLGADAGACLTISHIEESREEQSRVTTTIKVFWTEESVTETNLSKKELSRHFISFCGYDTLAQRSEKIEGSEL